MCVCVCCAVLTLICENIAHRMFVYVVACCMRAIASCAQFNWSVNRETVDSKLSGLVERVDEFAVCCAFLRVPWGT